MLKAPLLYSDVHEVAKATGLPLGTIRFFESQLADVFAASGINVAVRTYDERRVGLLQKMHQRMMEERRSVEDLRRLLLADLAGQRKALSVIGVASGKGGVGKTTFSINLAVAMARLGARTLLFDADLGTANVHVYAGLNPRGTIIDVIAGRARLNDIILRGFAGVDVVCGDSGIAKMADLNRKMTEFLGGELTQLEKEYDVIIVDTAAGLSAHVTEFLSIADEVVVVATPNLAATLDAYGVIKVSRQNQYQAALHLMVNQVRDEKEAHTVMDRIGGCAQKFLGVRPDILGYLLRDDLVEQTNAERQPLVIRHPTSDNAIRLRNMAETLNARRAGRPAERGYPT